MKKLNILFLIMAFVLNSVAQNVLTLPVNINFESPNAVNDWTLENGRGTNKWFIGSTTNSSNNVANGFYISNDGSITNVYTNNATSKVFAYTTIDFAQAGIYNISFDWRNYGSTMSFYCP